MVGSMKVTIDISDALLEKAQEFAVREGTTVDALAEDGMRRILHGEPEPEPEAELAAPPPEDAPILDEAPPTPVRDSLDHIGAAFGDLDA
jgi:hypothetical protein